MFKFFMWAGLVTFVVGIVVMCQAKNNEEVLTTGGCSIMNLLMAMGCSDALKRGK
jgi:hypothetical protein